MGNTEERKEIDYNPDNKLTVSNTYVRAIHPDRMGVNSMKLFRLVVTQCRKNDKEFFEYFAYPEDLAKAFGTNTKDIYRDILPQRSRIELVQSVLIYSTDTKERVANIISVCDYNKETGELYVKLSPDVTELFLQLKERFTQIPISSILAMKSKHSIRIYELICQTLNNRFPYSDVATEIKISLDEARRVTNTHVHEVFEGKTKKIVGKSYDQVGHFKAKVLRPALEDIESAAEWHIECKDIKRRGKISGFLLTIWDANGWKTAQEYIERGELPPRPKYRLKNQELETQVPGQMTISDYLKE